MPKEHSLYENLLVRKELLVNYLKMKTYEEDWHAVADAAMDLRELEVLIKRNN